MSPSRKFFLKILLVGVAAFAVIFLFRTGFYLYQIKSGKTNLHFTKITTSTPVSSSIKYDEIYSAKSPSYGAASPELTVIEFGNFACSYSQEASATVREMMLKYKDSVKFIYRDYPIDELHENSSYLSLAGKCAAAQGKFWQFHDKMFAAQDTNPVAIALQVGLDKQKFSDCLTKQTYLKDVQQDFVNGYKNGVIGTPTFFFVKKGYENKPVKIEGAMPKDMFDGIIEKMLK